MINLWVQFYLFMVSQQKELKQFCVTTLISITCSLIVQLRRTLKWFSFSCSRLKSPSLLNDNCEWRRRHEQLTKSEGEVVEVVVNEPLKLQFITASQRQTRWQISLCAFLHRGTFHTHLDVPSNQNCQSFTLQSDIKSHNLGFLRRRYEGF